MRKLFTNIAYLLQTRKSSSSLLRGALMRELPTIENAYLLTEGDSILAYGPMSQLEGIEPDKTIDLKGRILMPTFVDSHTHLVFAANREEEFVMKIEGKSYEEIAAAGGGILNSAKKLQETPEEVLFEKASERLTEAIKHGTGAIEIKSGYGLTTAAEIKMLHVIDKLKNRFPIPIKATFLGAHAFPDPANKEKYMASIIHEMLPQVYSESLADYVDVFCEKGYYTPDQMERILVAATKYDLKPKVHVNQFHSIGGIEVAIANGAHTVDHLEVLKEDEINLLKDSDTIPVGLPGCSFFLNIPYTPVRKIIDSGLPLVLASDFNPGSAPSFNMSMINSLACVKMKLLPEEAINATTYNAAFAMEAETVVGSITVGKKANFIVSKPGITPYAIPYHFGMHWIEEVFINSEVFTPN